MKLTDIQNNELINNLSDAKIHSIYFNFDADNPIQPQNLVISVSKLNADLERYQLVFHNTNSFSVKIQAGEQSINPLFAALVTACISSLFGAKRKQKNISTGRLY